MTCPDCTPLIVCARCTQAKVNFVRMMERETGIDIKNKIDYNTAYHSWKMKEKAMNMNQKLKEIRKKKGIPLKTMASMLKIPPSYLAQIERGQRIVGRRILRLLDELSLLGET